MAVCSRFYRLTSSSRCPATAGLWAVRSRGSERGTALFEELTQQARWGQDMKRLCILAARIQAETEDLVETEEILVRDYGAHEEAVRLLLEAWPAQILGIAEALRETEDPDGFGGIVFERVREWKRRLRT